MSAYEYWKIEVEYTAGVWTDVTTDVDTITGPISSSTGSSPETTGDPSGLSFVLHNVAFKYTPGNSLSAFALSSALRVRYSETIAGNTIYLFTGFIEFPEISNVNVSMNQDQTIAISAVDQLSRWERSQTFVSTMAEYIRYAGGSNLIAYYPLAEPAGPTLADIVGGSSLTEFRDGFTTAFDTLVTSNVEVSYNSADPLPGDDLAGLTYNPNLNASNSAKHWTEHRGTISATAASGQSLAIVFWINWTRTTVDGPQILYAFGATSYFLLYRSAADGFYYLNARDDSGGIVSIASGMATDGGIDAWRCLAVRITESAGTVEFWNHNAAAVSGTLSGTPTQFALTDLRFGGYVPASAVHLQVYRGVGVYSRADHLAQIEQGLHGLDRQTTGDRIRTLARYAGKTDADLVNVDTGGSVMQRARLAGMTVAQAMYEARDTEQGDLYVDGSGLLTFDDRRALLNI